MKIGKLYCPLSENWENKTLWYITNVNILTNVSRAVKKYLLSVNYEKCFTLIFGQEYVLNLLPILFSNVTSSALM